MTGAEKSAWNRRGFGAASGQVSEPRATLARPAGSLLSRMDMATYLESRSCLPGRRAREGPRLLETGHGQPGETSGQFRDNLFLELDAGVS
jgi:hypothetical protein